VRIKPWKKIGASQVLAESHGRSLIVQTYLEPVSGETREYSRFKANGFACIILAVTAENKVLAVQQYRSAVEEITIELPGGSQKHKGQTPESVAREEFSEETSEYEPGKVISLLKAGCWFEPSGIDTIYYPYLFLDCVKTNMVTQTDDGEDIELIQIPLSEWIKRCEIGQIRDSKSIVVTALAKKYLNVEEA